MNNKARFGIPMPEFRTDYGTLRTEELENIYSFINKRGILVADCFDRKCIIVHPSIAVHIRDQMIQAGFLELLIGTTLINIRKSETLSLAQNRVLEAVTPGALIINRNAVNESDSISVAIPDYMDLRDICSLYNGALRVFITSEYIDENKLIAFLNKLSLEDLNMQAVGVLEYPYFDEQPENRSATVVSVYGPNNIKLEKQGICDLECIKLASSKLSKYEIGEWT